MARKYTPRIRTQLRQAQRVERNNKLSAAEKLYRDILEDSPEVAEAWAGLGNVLSDSAESTTAYVRALELDPDNNDARRGLGMEPIPEPEPEPPAEPVQPAASAAAEQTLADPLGLGDTASDAGAATPAPEAVQDARSIQQPTTAPEPAVAQTRQAAATPEVHAHTLAPAGAASADVVDELLSCKNHPDRETTLRCYRCNEPICKDCAKRTSVGYLCPECVYESEEKFFTATTRDYIVGAIIALLLSSVAAWFAILLNFWVIFVAAAVGTLIGTATFYAVGRRRGRYLPQVVVSMIIVGAIPTILGNWPFVINLGTIWLVVYVVLAASAAYYRMRY